MDCTSRTEASPRSFRIIVASHSKRSRFSGPLGIRYPELPRGRAPNRCSFLHTATRRLLLFLVKLSTNSSQGAIRSFCATLISHVLYILQIMRYKFRVCDGLCIYRSEERRVGKESRYLTTP